MLSMNIEKMLLAEDKTLSQQELQLTKQRIALSELARASAKNIFLSQNDLWESLTHIAVSALNVERAEIWLYNSDRTKITRQNLYTLSKGRHKLQKDGANVIAVEDYPDFFSIIKKNRVLVLDDALNDDRVKELIDQYIMPYAITSLLKAPITYGDHLIGIIVLAHVGPPRKWFTGEQNFIASLADISAMCLAEIRRRKTQLKLKETTTELSMQKLALDKHAIVSISDRKGLIVDVNDKFCKINQYLKSELVGQPHSILSSGLHSLDYFKKMWDTISSGATWRGEIRNKRKDGKFYWVDTTIVPFRHSNGSIYKYVSIRSDISALKEIEEKLNIANIRLSEKVDKQVQLLREAQQQLVQSEKMASIGQLAAGVAHEINNPVGYVYSNLGSLKKHVDNLLTMLEKYKEIEGELGKDNKKVIELQELKKELDIDYLESDLNELISESQEGIKRVKQIVQDLKDFSHIEQSETQWGDLHKGLESTLNIVQSELKYKADIVKELGELPEVECVHSQINQIFTNLLVNAGHAIEDKGTITIRSGTDGGNEVWVSVEDTGKGIEKEHLTKIFDPFFTTKPVGKGTGLGLSLSYGIVQKHGGRLNVESTVGKGTKFTLHLPINSIGSSKTEFIE